LEGDVDKKIRRSIPTKEKGGRRKFNMNSKLDYLPYMLYMIIKP
jgi:hypothetical protein